MQHDAAEKLTAVPFLCTAAQTEVFSIVLNAVRIPIREDRTILAAACSTRWHRTANTQKQLPRLKNEAYISTTQGHRFPQVRTLLTFAPSNCKPFLAALRSTVPPPSLQCAYTRSLQSLETCVHTIITLSVSYLYVQSEQMVQ